jgi:site-specific DNA recombinase
MGKRGKTLRALIVIRLSRKTEATTSPERQREVCEKVCRERGYEVVGKAVDLGVSAGVPPAKREQLGPWLQRPQDYDVIVVQRIDRIARRLADLSALIAWAEEHAVTIVSATEKHFDLSMPFGDVIAMLIGKVAEMELEAIRSRTSSASAYTIKSGRWRGGTPPWGYRPEKQDDDDRWKLVQDPEQVKVIREVVSRVLDDDESLRSIAHDLTRRKVLTPRDRFAQLQEREVKNFTWHSGPLKRSLTSPTLLGRMTMREPVLDDDGNPVRKHGKKVLGPETVVRGPDGTPLQRAEAVLTVGEFERLGKVLSTRENRKEPGKRSTTLLLRVIHCGVCGKPAYRLKGGAGRRPRYRCASAQYADVCGNRTIDLDWADKEVEQSVLSRLGSMERMRRVWRPGSDVTAELAEVASTLEDLVDQLGSPAFRKGSPQRARLDERIEGLAARQAQLEAAPREAAGWAYVGTGETVAHWWAAASVEERNRWLQLTGVRVTWRSHTEGGVLQETGPFAGHVMGGKTVCDDFTIDVGEPDLNAAALPSEFTELAALRAAGAWPQTEALAGLPALMAEIWWREGPRMPTVET